MDKMTALDAWELEASAQAVLAQVGIKNPSMKIDAMSGGQARKVAVAAALLGSPDVLILDEPTNHMDVQVKPSNFLHCTAGAPLHIFEIVTLSCTAHFRTQHALRAIPGQWMSDPMMQSLLVNLSPQSRSTTDCTVHSGSEDSREDLHAVQFIEWMVNAIKTSGVTLLLVTHDRAFLEDTCTCILELDEGRGFVHRVGGQGGYERYRQRRAERRKAQAELAQDARVSSLPTSAA